MVQIIEEHAPVLLHWYQITPNPLNILIRGKEIDPVAIQELAESIRANGLIQPLVVVETPEGEAEYHLIAGERRWRATRSLGDAAPPLPCVVRTPMDELKQLITMGVENLQREDLDPIAEARYYQALQARGLDEAAIARETGKKRHHVKARLRLLDLPDPVQAHIEAGRIPLGAEKHLRWLSPDLQIEVADKMAGRRLKDIERVVTLVEKRTKQRKARTGNTIRPRQPRRRPVTISYDNLELAVRATCGTCEAHHMMRHDIPWEEVEAALNDQCDACEVREMQEACQQCPLADFLKALRQVHNGKGEPVGPAHLYEREILN